MYTWNFQNYNGQLWLDILFCAIPPVDRQGRSPVWWFSESWTFGEFGNYKTELVSAIYSGAKLADCQTGLQLCESWNLTCASISSVTLRLPNSPPPPRWQPNSTPLRFYFPKEVFLFLRRRNQSCAFTHLIVDTFPTANIIWLTQATRKTKQPELLIVYKSMSWKMRVFF